MKLRQYEKQQKQHDKQFKIGDVVQSNYSAKWLGIIEDINDIIRVDNTSYKVLKVRQVLDKNHNKIRCQKMSPGRGYFYKKIEDPILIRKAYSAYKNYNHNVYKNRKQILHLSQIPNIMNMEITEELIEIIKETANIRTASDDTEFNVYESSGGNFDYAYNMGVAEGEIFFARMILEKLGL